MTLSIDARECFVMSCVLSPVSPLQSPLSCRSSPIAYHLSLMAPADAAETAGAARRSAAGVREFPKVGIQGSLRLVWWTSSVKPLPRSPQRVLDTRVTSHDTREAGRMRRSGVGGER